MSEDRRKEIVRHLSEDDLNRLLAESTDEKLTERLIFIKRLYKGATLEDAADKGWASARSVSIGRERRGGGSAVYSGRDQRERSFCERRGLARGAVGHVGHLFASGFDVGVEF